jgi:hypothetical protein
MAQVLPLLVAAIVLARQIVEQVIVVQCLSSK